VKLKAPYFLQPTYTTKAGSSASFWTGSQNKTLPIMSSRSLTGANGFLRHGCPPNSKQHPAKTRSMKPGPTLMVLSATLSLAALGKQTHPLQVTQLIYGWSQKPLNKADIRQRVEKRAQAYQGEKDQWFEAWFLPTLEELGISNLSWESILDYIGTIDAVFSASLNCFGG
jgi:hypothetical protein